MSLTEDQTLVAGSDAYVLACALPGSGKSHTLVSLTGNLLDKNPAYRVLLITFTNAATREINNRLHKALGTKRMKRVDVFTFHSLALRMMKQAGMKERLCMGAEQHIMIERALRHSGLEMEHDEAAYWIETYGRELKANPEPGCEGWELYCNYKQLLSDNNCIDFNMVSQQAYLKLAREEIAPWPVTHILVDEFQDTDRIQYMWLYEHGIRGVKLVAVGDDDQAIYSFRGAAGYRNMVDFQRDFDAAAYVLRICFRCAPEILSVARRLIEHNEDRVQKPMQSGQHGRGEVHLVAEIGPAQMEAAVAKIAPAPGEWAVLARNNRLLDEIETYARKAGIPYKRLGGRKLWSEPAAVIFVRFLDTIMNPRASRYVSDVLGYLQESEEVIRDICLRMSRRRVGFGDLPIDSKSEKWGSATVSYHNLWEQCQQPPENKAEIEVRVAKALTILTSVRGHKGRDARVLGTVADILLAMKGSFEERIESLSRRLTGTQDGKEEEGGKALTLATLHAAKGLQWSRVWLLGSQDGICPSQAAVGGDAEGGMEEERRLYYVGMTRAINELVMSFDAEKEPSRFLFEAMPEEMEDVLAALARAQKNQAA